MITRPLQPLSSTNRLRTRLLAYLDHENVMVLVAAARLFFPELVPDQLDEAFALLVWLLRTAGRVTRDRQTDMS